MSKNQQEAPVENKYTPEQIAEMRSNMIKHYQSEIKFLKVQSEFERLQADVEEHRARKYSAMAHSASLFGDPEQDLQAEETPQPKAKKERKLKPVQS